MLRENGSIVQEQFAAEIDAGRHCARPPRQKRAVNCPDFGENSGAAAYEAIEAKRRVVYELGHKPCMSVIGFGGEREDVSGEQ